MSVLDPHSDSISLRNWKRWNGARYIRSDRCGICQETLEPGEPITHVDDERCHRACSEDSA